MKSLLKCCGSSTVVALHTRAFLIEEGTTDKVTELKEEAIEIEDSNSTPDACPTNKSKGDPKQNISTDAREIQCVAVAKDAEGNLWCAISRYDKSLALFCNAKWVVTHTSIKRVGCLVFSWNPVGMIIAGDMVGDATAFPLVSEEKKSKGRLLLGHTASMLTGMQLVQSNGETKLLTADRDEKVRISAFPHTTIIHGYLLGHDAFLCSIETSPSLPDLCITCGGDETVRLWNTTTFEQISMLELPQGFLPTQVSTDGERIGVIFHSSNTIHVYTGLSETAKDEEEQPLKLHQTLECETQPLGIVLQGNKMYVLAKEPALLQAYQQNSDGQYELVATTDNGFVTLLSKDAEGVVLPLSILEADKTTGHLKMQKLKETRGAAQEIPWHRIERRQKAKDSRNRRSRKRRKESQQD